MPPKKKAKIPNPPDDDDTERFALMMQTRLGKLKRSRNQRLQRVTSEANTSLEAVRSQCQKQWQQKGKKNREERIRTLDSLMKIMERKRKIEEEVVALMAVVCTKMEEVEAIINGGLEGRAKEVQSILMEAEANIIPRSSECRM